MILLINIDSHRVVCPTHIILALSLRYSLARLNIVQLPKTIKKKPRGHSLSIGVEDYTFSWISRMLFFKINWRYMGMKRCEIHFVTWFKSAFIRRNKYFYNIPFTGATPLLFVNFFSIICSQRVISPNLLHCSTADLGEMQY